MLLSNGYVPCSPGNMTFKTLVLKHLLLLPMKKDCTALCKQILNNNARFKHLVNTWNLLVFFFSLQYFSLETVNPFLHPEHPGCICQSPGVVPKAVLWRPPHSWSSHRFLLLRAPPMKTMHTKRCVVLQLSKQFPLNRGLKRSVLSSVAALLGVARPSWSAAGHTATTADKKTAQGSKLWLSA